MSLSKYDYLVGTGSIPTDAETDEITQILKQPLARISQIEEAVADYESKIKALRQEHDDLNLPIGRYRVLLSPMYRLPADCLREIFALCLPEDRNPTMSHDEAPMLLTRISSHWRHVALTTPGLWSSIHIAVPRSSPVFAAIYDSVTGERLTVMAIAERRAKAIDDWLSRAGTLPLKISLHEWDVYPPTEYCKKMLRCILPYTSRCKSISVTAPADSIADLKALQGSDTPLLESVKFNLFRDKSNPDSWGPGSILEAPRLSEVALMGFKGIPQLPVDWSKLTRLDLDGDLWSSQDNPTVTDMTTILQQCNKLTSCRILLGHSANPDNRTEFPVLSLPALESLWMFEAMLTQNFLAAFDAPLLRKLEYYHVVARRSEMPPPISNLLSNGKMEYLAFTPRTFAKRFIECLTECPLLKTLSLNASLGSSPIDHNETTPTVMVDSLLESFAPSNPSDDCLCPQLENFECLTEAHFSDQALLTFIQRKQSGTNPRIKKLRSVRVAFTRPSTVKDITASLATYISDGLSVDITYPPSGYRGLFSLYDGIPMKRSPYHQPPFF